MPAQFKDTKIEAVGHTALLPCPFCGASQDELTLFCDPSEGLDNSGPSRRIQCAGCNVEAPFYDTKEKAIAAWNRRMPIYDATPDLLKALRQIIAEDDTGPERYEPRQVGQYTFSQALGGSEGKFAAIARAAIAKAEGRAS